MDLRSEVILRQFDLISGRVLLVNPPSDELYSHFSKHQLTVWTWNFADHQHFNRAGVESHFSVDFPSGDFDQVIIFTPKSKELLRYVLHQVASQLPLNTAIFLVGEKKGGIEGAAKQLNPLGKTLKLDSARHCQLWQCILQKNESFKPLEDWLQVYPLNIENIQLKICALPGVFSQNRLDLGTQILLPYLKKLKSGKLADFGCGAGVISAFCAKTNPAHVIYALDVDAFALRSTQITFEQNALDSNQLNLQAVTGIEDAPTGLDLLVSNPPFHQGIRTHYAASEALCKNAKQHLRPHGELWIVANRFLNYESYIEQAFKNCHLITDQQGFKVLYAKA